MKKKKLIILIIILMIIGFASITTNIVLNGAVNIAANTNDLDVYFSDAIVNENPRKSVITDDTHITFTANLSKVNETYTLEYDVTNGSSEYDVKPTISLSEYDNEYLEITNTFETTTLKAKETRTGKLTIKLIKSYLKEDKKTTSITLELNAEAIEKTSVETKDAASKVSKIPVTSVDKDGNNLNATSYEITGDSKDNLIDKLVSSGFITNKDEVDALIEVKSDDFENLATTTFDVSSIASDGDTVIILHFNETKNEWEYIAEGIVTDGKVTGDFSSYSPVAFVVEKNDGTYQTTNYTLYGLMKENALNDTINFNINSETSETFGIYTTTDTDSGKEVYYYRGNADKVDNNLIFNNMCWKILHTTETGGVKIIYNGITESGKCSTQKGESTQIGDSSFNSNGEDNAYVGYMYGTVPSTSKEMAQTNTNDSTIKTYIDNWYKNNFVDTNSDNAKKIEDTTFCNDRSTVAGGTNNTLSTSFGTLGYGTNQTGYGPSSRSAKVTKSLKPSLACTQENDKFSVSRENGNGDLTYPVGLITIDEIIFAGYTEYSANPGDYYDNSNFLYTGSDYWTMSPDSYKTNANMLCLLQNGVTYDGLGSVARGVRPVVSLKKGTMVSGNGSTTNPYVVTN